MAEQTRVAELEDSVALLRGALQKSILRQQTLEQALTEADDVLRRLSEWDALNPLAGFEAPYGDAPHWQREIAKARAVLAEVAE